MKDQSPQAKGGKARSRSLSAQERSRIAREAAKKRWGDANAKVKAGSPDKPIRIAEIEVPCYVLDDERRVIATNGILDVLHMARGGAMVRGMNRLELFAAQNRLKPFVTDELLARIADPVRFRFGNNTAHGFESDVLIELAEAVIKADDAGVLQKQQVIIAHQCRVICSSLTRIGLRALIDEATGYQYERDSDELQKVLSAYILPEHRPWLQVVPKEFTDEVYRVYGWKRSSNNQGPRYAGKLIRQLVYEKLPKPVLPALDEKNPADEKYRRKKKHHQYLTENQGLDHFRSQIITIMTLLRVSKSKSEFWRNVDRLYSDQGELDLGLD
ncbi:MAG: P63C domain-containing protein [Pseudomonadota bacterium]